MDRRGMKPANIEVNIEELVLHGFSPGDRYRIAEALEGELARLLANQGLPSRLAKGGDADRLDGKEFNLRQGSRAESIGAQVARSVYGGMRR
jgi:hypothetical protein